MIGRRNPCLLRVGIGLALVMGLAAGVSAQVRIGLVIPGKGPRESEGVELRRGAELALFHANRQGGYRGQSFVLRTQRQEGTWGTSMKRIVNLVFEENVVAVLGSVDGMSAHEVEQVVTKGKTPFLSPWASDMTLSQGGIPWFFRLVPNDRTQARAILDALYQGKAAPRYIVLREEGYDGRVAEKAFLTAAIRGSKPRPTFVEVRTSQQPAEGQAPERQKPIRTALSVDQALEEVRRSRAQAVVLLMRPAYAGEVISSLVRRGIAVYTTAALAGTSVAARGGRGLYVVDPSLTGTGRARFAREFERAWGMAPTPAAAYAYDGMMVIVEAVRKAGTDTWKIRDAIASMRMDGLSGSIRFGPTGDRYMKPGIVPANRLAGVWKL